MRSLEKDLTNLDRIYIQILKNDHILRTIFSKIISKSATDSLKEYMDNKSEKKLEFNLLLIKLAFSDGITIKDIYDDTGKNLVNSVFLVTPP